MDDWSRREALDLITLYSEAGHITLEESGKLERLVDDDRAEEALAGLLRVTGTVD